MSEWHAVLTLFLFVGHNPEKMTSKVVYGRFGTICEKGDVAFSIAISFTIVYMSNLKNQKT
ncbi:MAG: hypothetical protein EA394_05195 [Bacteroidia bacterium]|nr:MAG: hypothetical protein EA394_05195 [Bacteroidia bacterium]